MLVIQSQQTVRNLLSSGEEGTDFVISVLGFLLLWDLVKEALNHLGFFSYLFRLFYWIMENYLWKIIYGKLLFMENTQLPTWCALQLSGVSRSGARTGGLWLHQLLPLEGAFLLLGPTWDLVHLGLPQPTRASPNQCQDSRAGAGSGASPGIGSVSWLCSSYTT